MSIINEAIQFVTEAHKDQVRKVNKKPYCLHLFEAGVIAARLTNDEEVIAATILHDVLEDTDIREEVLVNLFGERVTNLVKSNTDEKGKSWIERKQKRIDTLKSASKEEEIVCLADKLSNIRSLYQNCINEKDKVWEYFNEKDKTLQSWYFKGIADNIKYLRNTHEYKEYCYYVDIIWNNSSDDIN
ncbi:MAG: HD domain-containing protein [Clostridia bacterium]|nr:HD domain-containing protein [Clostridia bacterium]